MSEKIKMFMTSLLATVLVVAVIGVSGYACVASANGSDDYSSVICSVDI